eukprot:2927399-Prymnesium_polylepis.1
MGYTVHGARKRTRSSSSEGSCSGFGHAAIAGVRQAHVAGRVWTADRDGVCLERSWNARACTHFGSARVCVCARAKGTYASRARCDYYYVDVVQPYTFCRSLGPRVATGRTRS